MTRGNRIGRLSALSVVALLQGCGSSVEGDPRDQWVVSISTDAPIPQFGDRLVIEVLDRDGEPACGGCRRLLGTPERWPASFGIAAPEDRSREFVARVRLYRTELAGLGGLPSSTRVIDAAGLLPDPRGKTQVHVHLGMNCFGVEMDLEGERVCQSETGELGPLEVLSAPPDHLAQPGSWSSAARVPCSEPVPDGMVCVPGGVFLMGAPRYSITSAFIRLEPLVKLSPFALDRDEMTVGAYLDLSLEHGLRPPLSRSPSERSVRHYCTYDATDAASRAMPVNCISRDQAVAVCEAQGKRLPTEAEWEYAAGNAGQETRYPWGVDSDICAKTVIARNPIDATSSFYAPYAECRETPAGRFPAGATQAGADTDLTELGIRNLGGNLSEWVADGFAVYSEPCWSGRLLADPLCEAGDSGLFAPRGGAWTYPPPSASSYERGGQLTDQAAFDIGVRCAISR